MAKTIAEWDKEMQDKVRGPKIIAFAKKSHNEETLKFLSLMKAKKFDKSTYSLFIAKGSKYEINIGDALQKQFDPSVPENGPWQAATNEMLKLYTSNISKNVA